MKIKKIKTINLIRFLLNSFLLMILLILASCFRTAEQPAHYGNPQITITSPFENVSAGNIDIVVNVSNFNLLDKEGERNRLGEGHVIYYLDVPVPTYYDNSAITLGGTYKTDYKTTHTWQNVPPGIHTFSVQLVNNNNKPLPSPALDSVKITVEAPNGNPALAIETPQDNSDMPPGVITIGIEVLNFVISKEDVGSINREGEGHFIYYVDEDPPTDQGIPAITETSIVSTDVRHLWKTVTEGQHTFSVQLVNNDDTPLKMPVVAKVNVSVKPE